MRVRRQVSCLLLFFSLCWSHAWPQTRIPVAAIHLFGLQKTRPWVVERELLFQPHDSVALEDVPQLALQSKQNLYNLGLFTEVVVEPLITPVGLQLIVRVQERWYILGYPIVKFEERNSFDLIEAIRQRDFHRVSIGGYAAWRNLTGQNETLSARFLWGFSRKIDARFLRPALFRKANIDLYMTAHYAYEPEIIIGTENGRVQWRRLETQPLRRSYGAYGEIRKRLSPQRWYSIGIGYDDFRLADSLFSFQLSGETARFSTDYQRREAYPTVSVNYIVDKRDVRAFPLKGHKLHVFSRYTGWGGSFSSHFAKVGFSWAHHIPLSRRWNLAYGIQSIHTIGRRIPFFEKSYLGLYHIDFPHINHEIRGYEPYAIGGTQQTMLKSELKFAILPYQNIHLKFVPLPRFQHMPFGCYLTAFAEGAYVRDHSLTRQDDTFLDTPLFGYGFGLNVTGFYDMLGRVEYSWNHLGQRGVYMHATLPIK